MNTVTTPVEDLPELQDVMFAIQACRAASVAPVAPPLLSAEQVRHLRADSRARAWLPAHLLNSLR